MSLILLGINHKTAPIALREQVAIARESLADAARSLTSRDGVIEAMILSTCNRVEFLAATESSSTNLEEFFQQHFSIDLTILKPHLYEFRDREAVRHLFRVSASLDSMVVGEPQILGQVKEAYSVARAAGTIRSQLDPLLQSAFAAAKRVRSETEIGSSSVSIASVAVELAQKIFGSLNSKAVFLIGAGKMSELAARHLIRNGASKILITNRTNARAESVANQLAESVALQVIPWEEMQQAASQADIVITSTGASHPIFRKEDGQAFLQRRKNRPMLFIDVAVPRDVDPEMNRLEGIFLYDIDDLQSVAASHLDERSREASFAESLIAAEVDRYHLKLKSIDVAPLIVSLQQRGEEFRQAELRKIQSRRLSPDQYAAFETFSRSLMNKFLHSPMQALKQAAQEGNATRIDAIRETYSLTTTRVSSADAEINDLDQPDVEQSGIELAAIEKSSL